MASSSWLCRTTLDPNYAARVLLFADRATFAYFTGLVVTDTEPVAVVSLLELSSEVVKISRWASSHWTSALPSR
jgi:hypothetical protein